MLLRSSSTPILKSWFHQTKGSSPEPDRSHQLQRTKSFSLSTYFHPPPSHSDDLSSKITKNLLDSETSDPRKKIQIPQTGKIRTNVKSKERRLVIRDQDLKPTKELSSPPPSSIYRVFSSNGLGDKFAVDEKRDVRKEECGLQTLVVGGGMGSNGGRVCGGSGGWGRGSDDGGGGNDDMSGFFESNNNHRINSTDAYYQKMIEANPGNALLLGNYAKFLKEVRGDSTKAEEYCARAILADPNDGNALSLYADLIWITQKDAQRADVYFDQAVKSSPDDCYLLASYARFLWDADVDEEDEETGENLPSPPSFSHGASHHPPLTAAS